jgi:hypothetical protein
MNVDQMVEALTWEKKINGKETKMKIQVEMKDVYGEAKVYPVCEKAKLFAAIANTKTLTTETLKNVERLGYQVELIVRKEHLDLLRVVGGKHG